MRQLLTVVCLLLAASGAPVGATSTDVAMATETFIDDLRAGDLERAGARVDWSTMIERAARGLELPQEVLDEFERGFRAAAMTPTGLLGSIAGGLAAGGTLTTIHFREVAGEPSAVLRVLGEDGVNYLELVFAADASPPLIVDVYPFAAGELVSESARTVLVAIAAERSKSLLERLIPGSGHFQAGIEGIQAMQSEFVEGRFDRVLALHADLPESFATGKSALLLRLQASMRVSREEHEKTLALFREHHPASPATDLLSIDYYLFREEHEKSLACVDRLDRRVGGDPYLHVLRAGIHFDNGNSTAAADHARKAIAADESLVEAYWTLVTVSLAREQYDLTVDTLERLEEVFLMEFNDFSEIPEFAGFVKSEEYARWLARGEDD